MAAFAARAKCVAVHVIAFVAVDAARAQLRELFSCLGMTGRAGDLAMRTVQHEMGTLVVVEVPDAPVARIVARPAVCTQPALVDVISSVACHALLARVLEPGARMTFSALHIQVPADKRKCRATMIEVRFLPRCLYVTTLAVGSLLPGMPVVLAMTGKTLGGKFVAECPVQMAGLTSYARMTPAKGIARIAVVVESRGCPFALKVTGLAASTQTAAVDILLCMTSIAVLLEFVHV